MINPRVEFDLSILKENINKLKKQVKEVSFLFPVKCCNYANVLEIINDNDFGFDISNINEFNIIKKYLINQFVSVSGPLSYQLNNSKYPNIHIVSNNLESYKTGNGIRINFNNNEKFGYSRFGVAYTKIDEKIRNEIVYVHFHNSDHRNLKKCEDIYEEIYNVINYFPNLKILNIGGHLEDLSFEEGIEYLKKVRTIVPQNIALYVEIGDFLFKNVGTLYSKVVDIRYDGNSQIVTLNFSKMANQRWAYPVYNSNEDSMKTIFYGCSCCETDIYLETKARKLNIGDEVIFTNISPYSYQWNTSFNGVEEMEYIFK